MLKLTQCMIVKNEEHNLTRALNWGKSIFDEQIVVDTGSSDNTAALAEEQGAKVLHFKWIDDFSAARNYGISQCTGDWIFYLDADEYFNEADVSLMRPLIEKVDGLAAEGNDRQQHYNVIETPWVNLMIDNTSRQARIFRNEPYLRYTGALHEHLTALPGGYLRAYPVKDKPAIYHTGYVWSEENSKTAKGVRNFEIAKKELEKNPECAKLRLFAAEALLSQKKYGEAEKYFSEAMKNSDGSIWTERAREGYKQWLKTFFCVIDPDSAASGLLNSAFLAYSEAVKEFPDDPDYDIMMSMIFFKAKDIINSMRCFDASMSKNGGRISEGLMSSSHEAYDKLREICAEFKRRNLL